MANRKITVLNPAGYQELFQSGDNLIVDGAVNLQSNELTGIPTPSVNLDAANKSYVDAGDNANSSDITSLDSRLTNCLLYTSPSPRDATLSRMPSSA